MALQNSDLFLIERAGVQYKMTADQVADFVGAVKDFTAATIADRDAGTLTPTGTPKVGDRIFVTDASADASVDAGWAVYRLQSTGPNVYQKIQEQESMDLTITPGGSNLSVTRTAASVTIVNDSGDDAVIPAVDAANAGAATPSMFINNHVPAVPGLTAQTNPINIVDATQTFTFGIT